MQVVMLGAISSTGIGKQAKRETAMVSCNILDTWHSGNGVILLFGLRMYDAHPSVTFILSDMQRTPNSVVMFVSCSATPAVRDSCLSILNVNLAPFLLVLCLTLVFERLVLGGGL